MTDPEDAPKPWPTGLKDFLRKLGATSLVDALKKKVPKPVQKIRKPYAELDTIGDDEV